MARIVSVDDYFRKAALGEKMRLVDLRDLEAFQNAHIRDAISLPFERLDALASAYLGRPGTQIFVYAGQSQEDLVHQAVSRLNSLGYGDAYACVSDFDQWRRDGAPIHSNPSRFRLNFAT